MKAVMQERYGPPAEVLKVRDVARPVFGDQSVLVRVRAALVHADVWHLVTGTPHAFRLATGLRKPRTLIPGNDLAGHVEAVGARVTRFRPGDEVFGMTTEYGNGAAFAEYAVAPERLLAVKPGNVTFEQAASVPTPGSRMLMLGGLSRLKAGDHVLINGAGGCVGSLALQLARAVGARVTGVDRTETLEMMRGLGADDVVDFTQEDVRTRPGRYDFIFDVASTLSLKDAKRLLTPTGVYWLAGHDHYEEANRRYLGSIVHFGKLAVRSPFDRHLPPLSFKLPTMQETLETLRAMLESRTLTPIVGRTFPLDGAAAALGCLQKGGAAGRLVIVP